MKIKTIKLTNFKRFNNLTIQDLPESAKLIVLIGPNGCGKSSLFDAFYCWRNSLLLSYQDTESRTYYNKRDELDNKFYPGNQVKITFHEHNSQINDINLRKKTIYARSAYRNESEFHLDGLGKVGSALDEIRFKRMTQNDAAVSKNYKRLCSNALEDIFEKEKSNTSIGEFREKVLGNLTQIMQRLFNNPTLTLNTLGNPLKDGTFRFNKGNSIKFPYQNLSAGEKAAFDLVLDIFVKQSEFDDTVFCIDEPEAHMHTKLQGPLLEEFYNLISEKSQLWIATHSIGMIRKAYKLWEQNNNAIVFLDFNYDFDQPKTLKPIIPNRAFWRNAYNIALGDLAALVAPDRIILCEGNTTKADKGFDAECYNKIFSKKYPNTLFISAGNNTDVEKSNKNLIPFIKAITKGIKTARLIDRDDSSSEEVEQNQRKGITTLGRRNIENYLLDDEILIALCKEKEKKNKTDQLLKAKQNIVSNDNNNLKPHAGEIYNKAKEILNLTEAGRNHKAFMRDTLSPLITEDMTVYKELENIINQC